MRQILTVLSSPPVAAVFPSGLVARAVTEPWSACFVMTFVHVFVSQISSCPLYRPARSQRPSGVKATSRTELSPLPPDTLKVPDRPDRSRVMVEDGGVTTESLRIIFGSGIITALRPATSAAWEGHWIAGI